MRMRRSFVSVLVLAAALVFAGPLVAGAFFFDGNCPPVGDLDESYYEGIWQLDIQERCYRECDGGYVPFGDRLFVAVWLYENDGGYYWGYIYPTLEDALYGYPVLGQIYFVFDSPNFVDGDCLDAETYLADGWMWRYVDNLKFFGECFSYFQAWLKTTVEISQNKLYSRLTGWSVGFCESFLEGNAVATRSVEENEFHKCKDDFVMKWVEENADTIPD